MSLSKNTLDTIKRLNRVATDLNLLFSCRDGAIELMKLALLCQEHVLLLGPPGTGKSELVARFAAGIQADKFHYLLTRFSEPAELFGPMSMDAFREGRYEVVTKEMLPEAQVAFLDEVFQASSAILNTLLALLNERIFFNGSNRQKVPLITLFGASNALPDDPALRAFADRFPLRIQVDPVPDDALGELFERGWDLEVDDMAHASGGTLRHLDTGALHLAYGDLKGVDDSSVMSNYQEVVRQLRGQGVAMSDRRLIKGRKFIRGAAMLDFRSQVEIKDFWPLNHMWNTLEEAATLRGIVQPLVEAAGGPPMLSARPLEDLVDELEDLEGRMPDSDSALTTHLAALARLRREILLNHGHQVEILARVKDAVQRAMETLQPPMEA